MFRTELFAYNSFNDIMFKTELFAHNSFDEFVDSTTSFTENQDINIHTGTQKFHLSRGYILKRKIPLGFGVWGSWFKTTTDLSLNSENTRKENIKSQKSVMDFIYPDFFRFKLKSGIVLN